ncbi:MAG: hypothetical protein NTY51_11260 [Deltaproteobacteria bacterium]|nr:hypothetical protein [Deltaproteobacteria bacterium]
MKCDKCSHEIKDGDEREFNDQTLCDDCYMDVLSPTRTCDPWAVFTAKSLTDNNTGSVQLNETQTKILQVLKETGGVEFPILVEKVGSDSKVVEREFAALRHIEKVRAEMRGDRKVVRLW